MARVRFDFPTSLWVGRNGYGQLVEEAGDGSSVRSFRVHQVNPFLRWILSLCGEAEILEPPDDKREERDVARAKLEFYQLVQTGGRFMVLLGATCLVDGWAASLLPRYPNLMPSARGERRPLS